MAIVFDEIVSEVIPPSTDRAESGSGPTDRQAAAGIGSQAELQRDLERIQIRQLRLMAD